MTICVTQRHCQQSERPICCIEHAVSACIDDDEILSTHWETETNMKQSLSTLSTCSDEARAPRSSLRRSRWGRHWQFVWRCKPTICGVSRRTGDEDDAGFGDCEEVTKITPTTLLPCSLVCHELAHKLAPQAHTVKVQQWCIIIDKRWCDVYRSSSTSWIVFVVV